MLAMPLDVGQSHARVWIGAVDEPLDVADVRFVSRLGTSTPDSVAWREWASDDGTHVLKFQWVLVEGLDPDTRYRFDLQVDGRRRSRAFLRTLPRRLPGPHEPPFVVFLGSCFSRRNDREGRAGQVFSRLPALARPHVKFLCGDQVYLDSPWYRFLLLRHDEEKLQRLYFEKYSKTWTQEFVDGGYRKILADGANWFSADDHEFWNNAPNWGRLTRVSATKKERRPTSNFATSASVWNERYRDRAIAFQAALLSRDQESPMKLPAVVTPR